MMQCMRPSDTAYQLHQRRLQSKKLRQAGYSKAEVARRIGAHRSSIGRWDITYQQKGKAALQPRPIPGRPAKLSGSESKRLTQRLAKGSLSFGYASEYWTLARIRCLIQKQFHVSYKSNGIWYLLQRLGWSCQRPQRRAAQRDEESIRRWKRYVWPQIKKTHMSGRRPLFSSMKVGFVSPPPFIALCRRVEKHHTSPPR